MKPENVFVVRSGPKLDKVRRMPNDPKWKNGRKFMVGYVGVIGQQEGLDLLLEAVQHIVKVREREDVQFVVVGSGPEQNAIRRMASDMGLGSFVTFTGRVADDLLMTILSTADICVNPDRVNALNDKSTMNKILEYMALGKPIVQFDVTEGRFSAGEASLYADKNDPIDFGNKILELLADEHRREQMGLFGRKRVETQLSWDYEAPKLLAAYNWIFEK